MKTIRQVAEELAAEYGFEVPVSESVAEPVVLGMLLDEFIASVQDEPEWLVDGLIPASSWSILGGPPKTFKSMFAQNLAIAVAAGAKFFGRQVLDPGPVVYVLEEGVGKSFAARLASMREFYGKRHDVRVVFKKRLLMTDPANWRRLRSTVALAEASSRGHRHVQQDVRRQ